MRLQVSARSGTAVASTQGAADRRGDARRFGRWRDRLVLVAAALVLYMPVLLFGMPHGHDGAVYAAWLSAFTQDLAAGDLYPRWLSAMNGGAGSPAFFFYPPFAYFVAAGFELLLGPRLDLFHVLAVSLFPFFAASGLALHWAVRRWLGRAGALAAALAYLAMPYHYGIDLWFRGDVAEVAAYAFAPLCFGFLARLEDDWRMVGGLAAAFALAVVTHLPTAVILTCGLGLVALWQSGQRKSAGLLLRLALGLALGLAASGLYLVPALTMQDMVTIGELWGGRLRLEANFLFTSLDPHMPALAAGLLGATFAALPAALGLMASPRRTEALPLVTAAAAIWFAMSPLSAFLWEVLPVLYKLQFPWRFALLLDLALAALIGLAVTAAAAEGSRSRLALCAASGALLLIVDLAFAVSGLRTQLPFAPPAMVERVRHDLAVGRDAKEYLPVAASMPAAAGPRVQVLAGRGTVEVLRWRSRDLALRIDAEEPMQLLLRQHYVPLWQATAQDGRPLAVIPAGPAGLLAISVPAGESEVSLRLVRSAAELGGLALSLAGLAGIALLFAAPAAARRWRR
jgi:uncharacterized membrane protein